VPSRLIFAALACVALLGCPGEPKPAPKAVPDPSAGGVVGIVGSVNKVKMKASLMAVLNAAKMHQAESGKAPADAQTLIDAEAISEVQATDLWGNHYLIDASGRSIEIVTYGADAKPGGDGPNTDWSTKDLR
jgi:hypothetical protein